MCSGFVFMHRFIFLVSLLFSLPSWATEKLSSINLPIADTTISVEVALTTQQMKTGLMYRKELPKNSGMLFVFQQPTLVCMWMKNTLIPLSVAFITDNGIVTNVEDMQVESLDLHCAHLPVKYVLEMNAGWFSQKNIKPGTHIPIFKKLSSDLLVRN